ncbi:hypothetical protein ID866_12742 [Astraeus odoratus]|nr:hypothetical protein ID866_12742 [Astraeus odoratus]
MEVLTIKVLLMKKQKQAGEDEESDNGEEEAEGSGSVSALIFQLCTPVTQSQLPTPVMDPATPAGIEQEGKEDPIALNPTPSPPCKKAHHVWVRSASPLTLAPGPVPPMSMSTSHLALTGGSTLTAASAAPPSLVQPCQPGEGIERMTWLEHEVAKMTRNMHHWQDDIVADYLELNQHVKTMEDNQRKFIWW